MLYEINESFDIFQEIDFNSSNSLREISVNEIEYVNGGLVNVAGGAAIGAGTYLIYSWINDSFSWGGLAGATTMGAVTSGFSALGVGAIYSSTLGAAAGAAAHNAVEHGQAVMSNR